MEVIKGEMIEILLGEAMHKKNEVFQTFLVARDLPAAIKVAEAVEVAQLSRR